MSELTKQDIHACNLPFKMNLNSYILRFIIREITISKLIGINNDFCLAK